MATIKKEQAFKDETVGEDYFVNQSIQIDEEQQWVYIYQNGNELSMSLQTFIKFNEMIVESLQECIKKSNS